MATELLAQIQKALGKAFQVERELGGAGMSRVFIARDVALDRQIVVKVLPPDLAAGLNADRFRREIQLAAKLQHPHIVPLLSAGAKAGLLFYTMPFIAGENLRTRLVRLRELTVADATRILREVADALEYAHEQGVVHRDIKPENILFSGSHALVTDFGVSKALSSATSEIRPAGSDALTSLGVALGTPTYMAPEQAAADPNVDHRADIYSLGVVGYEILAGRPPFTGMTPQQVLSAQVTVNPDQVTQHRPNIPPSLAAAIMKCLEKHPSDRWQTAAELRTQLETVFTPSGATQPVTRKSASTFSEILRPTPRRVMIAAAAAGIVIAGIVLSTIALKKDDLGFTIGETHQVTNLSGVELSPALSPDGKMVAYVAASPSGKAQIFLRQVIGGRAVPLTDGSTDALWPRWKPDASALIYNSRDGTLYSIPPLGGSPTAILGKSTARVFGDCDWSPAGTQLVCSNAIDGALYLTGANGENPRRLTNPTHDVAHSPIWSPDGKRIAYVAGNLDFVVWGGTLGNLAGSSIWVMPLSGGHAVRITDETHLNMSPVWAPDGEHILFVSSLGGARDIYSQRIRSDGTPHGNPVRLTTGLNPHSISLSADGRYLAYSVFTTTANVWSAAINGTQPISPSTMRQITFGNQTIETAAVSRDGHWLAYDSNLNGNADIYKVSLDGGEPQQLTHDPADDFKPDWSPDASEIAFHSFRNGNRDVFVMSADGSRTETVVATPRQERNASWSADGRSIVYAVMPDSQYFVTRTSGGWGTPHFLIKGLFPSWSPDGKTIAAAGFGGIAFIPSGGGHEKLIPIENLGGQFPGGTWSADSRLFYFAFFDGDGTSRFSVLDVATGFTKGLLHLSDPLRQLYQLSVSAGPNRIYFVMGSRESDVWVMELTKK